MWWYLLLSRHIHFASLYVCSWPARLHPSFSQYSSASKILPSHCQVSSLLINESNIFSYFTKRFFHSSLVFHRIHCETAQHLSLERAVGILVTNNQWSDTVHVYAFVSAIYSMVISKWVSLYSQLTRSQCHKKVDSLVSSLENKRKICQIDVFYLTHAIFLKNTFASCQYFKIKEVLHENLYS